MSLNGPLVMGILNVTPDSFFDGGDSYRNGKPSLDSALRKAEAMLSEGASIIDVGGESTRPGAAAVSEQEECDRVLPVVEALVTKLGAKVSVDTSTPKLMRSAAQLGAWMINDVRTLQRPGALEAATSTGLAICLMHMQGAPQQMQVLPKYQSVTDEVIGFLQARKRACVDVGVSESKIYLDPGIGFGKNDEHNLALIRHLPELASVGPVLLGVSRKSLFGRLLGRELGQRLSGSLAVALLAAQKGAAILRVHDVAETCDALRMWQLIDSKSKE